jgi:hypothetical protein
MARTVSKTETYIGYGILLLLVIIAGAIFLQQSRFSSAILKPDAFQRENLTQELIAYAPKGLVSLSPTETFGPENLSDKIDGKAELYLSAGFVNLAAQRFAAEQDPEVWMEAFVYNMGSTRDSFAVYSLQRRFEAENLDLTKFAYKTENALYFIHGPYYLEIISSAAQDWVMELMLKFGRDFVQKVAASQETINELALFPLQYIHRDSITLLPSNGFGFDRFNWIFTAQYTIAAAELTAFISQRKSPTEAAELVKAYTSFLGTNGGNELKSDLGIPGAKMVEIMDTYELIFYQGSVLAGVHGAENKKAAEELALMLKRTLSETGQ